jgi:hypothetical protein
MIVAAACGGSGTPPTPDAQALAALQNALAAANAADPASIIAAHYAARNAFDVNTSMTFVSPTATFTSPQGEFTGTEAINTFVQQRINQGYVFILSNIATSGNAVNFDATVFQNGEQRTVLGGAAQVENGLITRLDTFER